MILPGGRLCSGKGGNLKIVRRLDQEASLHVKDSGTSAEIGVDQVKLSQCWIDGVFFDTETAGN